MAVCAGRQCQDLRLNGQRAMPFAVDMGLRLGMVQVRQKATSV